MGREVLVSWDGGEHREDQAAEHQDEPETQEGDTQEVKTWAKDEAKTQEEDRKQEVPAASRTWNTFK